jgi:hypothetical protein
MNPFAGDAAMDVKSIASIFALAVSACASANEAAPISKVPDNLKPAANESLAMIASAKGV